MDSRLHPDTWQVVQQHFSGLHGHTFNVKAVDSNAMLDLQGNCLPHFTQTPPPHLSGVDLFAQELSPVDPLLIYPYVSPPPL